MRRNHVFNFWSTLSIMAEHQIILQQHCSTGELPRLSEADFYKCLEHFFRPLVSSKPIDWTCIQKSEKYFAPFFKFHYFGCLYFEYIFRLFEDFRVRDIAVTDPFLKKYCRFMAYNVGFPLPDPDEFPYSRSRAKLRYCKHMEAPKDFKELLSLPFLLCYSRSLMWILRYNAVHTIQDKDVECFSRYVLFLIRRDPFLVDNVDSFRWNQKDDTVRRRRLKLILIVVDSMLKFRIMNFTTSYQALYAFFQAIPDPYVTLQEISGFLMRRLMPSENQLLYIKSFQESCMRYFPGCKQEFKPRSLKHLARCKVRKCMDLARTMPHGVLDLGLPRELVNYILIQRWHDQYKLHVAGLSSSKSYVPINESLASPNVLLDLPKIVKDNS